MQPIIDEHYAAVRRAAWSLTGDAWDADEIAQETFLVAMRNLHAFRSDSEMRTWLMGICIRLHRSRFRATVRRVKRIATLARLPGRKDTEPAADVEPETHEWNQGIWRHVRRLPAHQAEIVVLRFAEEMSLDEIALAIECPLGTVKSRLHRALARLKLSLSRDLAPCPPPQPTPPLAATRTHP